MQLGEVKVRKNFVMVLFVLLSTTLQAQHLTHEIGFHLGVSTIQTDYGVRNNYLSTFGNRGTSISFSHTMHFFNKDLRWNYDDPIWSHLAVRSDINFITNIDLEHHGKYVEGLGNLGVLLRAMTGSTKITSVGFQLEYYLKCLRTFIYPYSDNKWNPFILGGVKYSMFQNTLNSNLGDWRENPSVLPSKWRPEGAVDVGKGSSFSLVFGVGTRYKLGPNIDLSTQLNWQSFFSDTIDGLKANVPENKDNEWLLNFQVGVIYHLNYSKPFKLF